MERQSQKMDRTEREQSAMIHLSAQIVKRAKFIFNSEFHENLLPFQNEVAITQLKPYMH